MKKRTSDNIWIPFWVDKWIWGSMRIEFTPEERAVWIDLLALAAKDNGFIRANEDIPYLLSQLAGMLIIPENLLKQTIEKLIEKNKLVRFPNETLYIKKWEKYQLSESYPRVIKHRIMKGLHPTKKTAITKNVTMSQKSLTKSNQIISNQIISNHILAENPALSEPEKKFQEFWEAYPREGRHAKEESKKKFVAIYKQGKLSELIKGFHGYLDFLKAKKVNENFNQRPMYAKTFLNGRWEEFVGFKYEPRL